MRRANFTALILLITLLLLNIYSFLNINSRFISYLNSSLKEEVVLCGSYLQEELEGFEIDLNSLLYDHDFAKIFTDEKVYESSKQSLQIFYAKYRDLVNKVYVFDNKLHYFGLYINESDEFVVDYFSRQYQEPLSPRDKIVEKDGVYYYHYPYFNGDRVSGNIIVEINFERFVEQTFSFYPHGETILWQWVINSESEIIKASFPKETEISSMDILSDSIENFSIGIIKHSFKNENGHKERLYSAYYPLNAFRQNLGIIFTASLKDFSHFFIRQNLLVSLFSLIITIVFIFYLLHLIRKRTSVQKKLMMSEIVFRQVIEKFPVGIMILDSRNIIRNINSAAQQMLFIDQKENLIGQDFSNKLLISNKYLLKDYADSLDPANYLYYEKDGIETVIFRVEEATRIGGEELRLVALIDVSPIERSRRQEVAGNKAKSDFLASMSHEIRTPMNGILGMVASLLDAKLPAEQMEKVRIIKKSSGLLMTIINDILDYSKMEAGKLLLEEIPFSLREEISLVLDLFKPLIEEKGLQMETEIKTNVPDQLIGDPFRLRQIISNLVGNAIKFTEKGKIIIGAELTEELRGSLQILFSVEDSGIGIPSDKLNSIFGSYTQSQGSTSRKFGGTGLGTSISKQLVELMNGEIWVESPSRLSLSEHAPGSKFCFTVEMFSNEKIKKEFDFSGIQSFSKITILMLSKEARPDKNPIYALLNDFGVNIVIKIYQDSTIDAIIHHLEVKKDLYNLILIADKLEHEGFGVAHRLQEEGLLNKWPTILVSSNDQPGNYKICKKLGIDYYLIEPFESKEVFDIVTDIFPALKDRAGVESILSSLPDELSILVVDDNQINQKVAQTIFKNMGYEIDIASNGSEAVSKVTNNSYDIVFMDLFMPELDGFDAARELRKRGIKTPIIAMSADIDDERKVNAAEAGMDSFLPKPVKLESVKQLLMKMFSKSVK